MAKDPKRHHFVARAYMLMFSSDGKHEHGLFKNSTKHIIPLKLTSIDKICVENIFYTVIGKNGKNTIIKSELARFEDNVPNRVFSSLSSSLLYPFRNNGVILDRVQKFRLVDSIVIQLLRGRQYVSTGTVCWMRPIKV